MAKATKKTATRKATLGKIPNPQITEARRYIDNAREILRTKAKKDGHFYQDKKYIRMAGHTIWCGVLESLMLIVPPLPKSKRMSIEYIRDNIAKRDKKLLTAINNSYETTHLVLSYDGNQSTVIVADALNVADAIIDKIETMV